MSTASAGAPLPSGQSTGATAAALVVEGDDPLAYQDQLNFNTRGFPQYSHVIECSPPSGSQDRVIRLCRCWQSKKFPYCDDTHKVLMEAGDNVGPFVAKLRGGFADDTTRQRNSLQQPMPPSHQRSAYSDVYSPAHAFCSAEQTSRSSGISVPSPAELMKRNLQLLVHLRGQRAQEAAAAATPATPAAGRTAALRFTSPDISSSSSCTSPFSSSSTSCLRYYSLPLSSNGGTRKAAVAVLLLGGAAVSAWGALRAINRRRQQQGAAGQRGGGRGGAEAETAAAEAAATAAARAACRTLA